MVPNKTHSHSVKKHGRVASRLLAKDSGKADLRSQD